MWSPFNPPPSFILPKRALKSQQPLPGCLPLGPTRGGAGWDLPGRAPPLPLRVRGPSGEVLGGHWDLWKLPMPGSTSDLRYQQASSLGDGGCCDAAPRGGSCSVVGIAGGCASAGPRGARRLVVPFPALLSSVSLGLCQRRLGGPEAPQLLLKKLKSVGVLFLNNHAEAVGFGAASPFSEIFAPAWGCRRRGVVSPSLCAPRAGCQDYLDYLTLKSGGDRLWAGEASRRAGIWWSPLAWFNTSGRSKLHRRGEMRRCPRFEARDGSSSVLPRRGFPSEGCWQVSR